MGTMAIVLLSRSLGYWNFTEIITCLGPLNTLKDDPCWPVLCFQNLLVNKPTWKKTPTSHPLQCILHKCQMISMCSDGQYAAFNVNIPKHYIHFPIKSTQTTHNSKKITSQKLNNKKTTFSQILHYFGQPNGKVTLVCGQIHGGKKYLYNQG